MALQWFDTKRDARAYMQEHGLSTMRLGKFSNTRWGVTYKRDGYVNHELFYARQDARDYARQNRGKVVDLGYAQKWYVK